MKKLFLALVSLIALSGSLSGCQKPGHLTGPDGATDTVIPNGNGDSNGTE